MTFDADAGPDLPGAVVLGSIAQRALALLIDQLLVAVPVVLVAFAAGLDVRSDLSVDQVVTLNAIMIALGTVHEIVGVAVWERTIGKHVLRLRVVRSSDAGRVGWTYSAVRSLVTSAAGLVPTIGIGVSAVVYLWAAVDPRRQGVHDKLAGTLVIRAGTAPVS